uniref:Kazal-like domain-containing protein n=1 Tax=Bactrocera dorsalis TaxID=27457 RepID=A0A034WLJ9_BACDO
MLFTNSCCLYAVVLMLAVPAYSAPTEQHSVAASNKQRARRQIFSDFGGDNPFFTPVDFNFGPNPLPRPQWGRPGPGEPLIFSNDRRQAPTSTTNTTPSPPNGQQANANAAPNVVFINNQPIVATIAPFTAPTTASPQFLNCFGSCPTTSEYNPVCASNQQQYQNPQKFDCARQCGADIQIVRRGACQGLFPMQRG